MEALSRRRAPMTHRPRIARCALVATLCVGLASASSAQGGWRQWDVHLRDGTRVVASPLGAPDDTHLSISVGAREGPVPALPRARIHYLAARPTAGDSLPPAPAGVACEDAIVRRDGSRTAGRVTLTHVAWSEGTITQRGVVVDLRDVAYVVLRSPPTARKSCGRAEAKRGAARKPAVPSAQRTGR